MKTREHCTGTGRRRGLALLAAAIALGPGLAVPAAAQNVRAKGVDSLHVRANVQPQYNTTTVDAADASSEWLLRRARLGVRVWLAGWLRGDLEADFGKGGAKLTDAAIRLEFDPRFRLRAGQYKKPFDALELTSSKELLVIERDGAPRGTAGPTPNGLVTDLLYAARDIGAEWNGTFGRWSATVAGFNGSGANTSDEDDGKQVAARLTVEMADGWSLAGAWTANRLELPPRDAPVLEEEWVQAGEIALTRGEYAEPGLQVLAQAMFGDNWDGGLGGGPEASFLAAQAIAAWHVAVFDVPYLIGWEPAGRVGWTDPDTDVDDDDATLWTAGVNLYHHERVKTQLGVDVLSPAEGDSEAAFRLHAVFGF
ncbi:MAG: porin [Gemmatimonadota bacterium]|nr:porin [Gemmatimonadota bacterium]